MKSQFEEFDFSLPDEKFLPTCDTASHVYPVNGDVDQTGYSSDEGMGSDDEIGEDHGVRVQFVGRGVPPIFTH